MVCNYNFKFLNLSELPITETELKLIANAAIIGDKRIPKKGYKTPAAMGTPSTLYTKANNKFCFIFFITPLLNFIAFEYHADLPLPK